MNIYIIEYKTKKSTLYDKNLLTYKKAFKNLKRAKEKYEKIGTKKDILFVQIKKLSL